MGAHAVRARQDTSRPSSRSFAQRSLLVAASTAASADGTRHTGTQVSSPRGTTCAPRPPSPRRDSRARHRPIHHAQVAIGAPAAPSPMVRQSSSVFFSTRLLLIVTSRLRPPCLLPRGVRLRDHLRAARLLGLVVARRRRDRAPPRPASHLGARHLIGRRRRPSDRRRVEPPSSRAAVGDVREQHRTAEGARRWW